MKKRLFVLFLIPFVLLSINIAAFADESLPEEKRTVLEQYLTAKEAYALYLTDPNRIHILDVRTPGEYIFVGHAPMAANIPLKYLAPCIGTDNKPIMPFNVEFIAQVEARYNRDDMILVMCRSGGRSAMAIDLLTQVGFTNLHNITDGFEGEKDADGKMTINGWKNSGAPWTYQLDPNLICVVPF